jgi:heme-degrading monooxygenase HmoA
MGDKMGVKILSKRNVSSVQEESVIPLIIELRKLAMVQPGFRYEETWRHLERPEEYLVVRAWDSEDQWQAWHANKEMIKIQDKIEAALGRKTEYVPYAIIDRVEKKVG